MISKSVQLAKEDISKEMSIFISRDMIARFERDGNDCTKSSLRRSYGSNPVSATQHCEPKKISFPKNDL